MRALLTALVLFLAGVQFRTVNLTLPHALRAGESATLLVSVGKIPRSAEIEITTPPGDLVGVISPYGIRPGNEAGTYTVPLPPEAISGRKVWVWVAISANGKKRAPTMKEVKRVRVVVRKK